MSNTKKHSYDEVFAASTQYFNGDELAAGVFTTKYALKDDDGNYLELTPDDMHRRLAREFARIEAKYPNPMSEDQIYDMLRKHDPATLGMGAVVPQGSPMSAIGNNFKLQSLSNCFVVAPPADSYGGILFTDQEQAQIMKRRGGVGFDISTIRPKGIVTQNAAGTTDGIGVFMERFSNTCREVAQGGRRGALMLTISILHPEVETFINIKRDLKKVTGANISIRITDEFMKAVETDSEFTLRWPCDVPAAEATITKVVPARHIWNQIIDSAWTSAEPGLLFWDTVQRNTPTEVYKSLGYGNVSTNPCGEIVLSPYDSCRLIVLDLSKFVSGPFTQSAKFDFKKFDEHVHNAQRLMDDLVDLELEAVDKIIAKIGSDPEPDETKRIELNLWKKIKEAGSGGRRTGLGITAMGDTLAMLGIKYGSPESIQKVEEIYKALSLGAYRSSVVMAKERGAFPVYGDWMREMEHPFLKKVFESCSSEIADMWRKHGRRNIALTTTAPAGSVSTLTQTTSGIEPAFLLSYKRRRKLNPNDQGSRVDFVDPLGDKWQEYTIYHHWYRRWLNHTGIEDPTPEQAAASPYAGATANEIDWVASTDLQAAAQRWLCHSISKTCNLPNSATRDNVAAVYMNAWKAGCKGFTVYRDGCRTGVLVADEPKDKASSQEKQPDFVQESHAPRRPKELDCDIHRVTVKTDSGAETYLVLVGLLGGKPYEIFCGLSEHVEVPKKAKRGVLLKQGKKDGISVYTLKIPLADDDHVVFKDVVNLFDNPLHGSITRTLSLSLRHGIPVQYVVEQLQKDKHSDMMSFSRGISRVLKGYIPNGTKSTDVKQCPSCSAIDSLKYQEGCVTCMNCSFSKCS